MDPIEARAMSIRSKVWDGTLPYPRRREAEVSSNQRQCKMFCS